MICAAIYGEGKKVEIRQAYEDPEEDIRGTEQAKAGKSV